jgi:hypothetical protein
LTGLLLIAACAAPGGEEREDGAAPEDDPRVGTEVARACFVGQINGFRDWDRGKGLILRQGTNEEFLVTFAGPCITAGNAQRIGLTETFGSGGCLRSGDALFVSEQTFATNRPFASQRCLVRAVYPYDETDAQEDEE